jgi:hypothetical protein
LHRLVARTFRLDVLACYRCGGRREVIAVIPSGAIAKKILAHLKLPVEATGFATIRGPPQRFDDGWAQAANEDCGDDEYADLPFPSEASGQAFEDDAA